MKTVLSTIAFLALTATTSHATCTAYIEDGSVKVKRISEILTKLGYTIVDRRPEGRLKISIRSDGYGYNEDPFSRYFTIDATYDNKDLIYISTARGKKGFTEFYNQLSRCENP